jgi:hypothetical protein
MPWSSNRLSQRELERTIIPTLELVAHSSQVSLGDLKSATMVAISIDTGRQMEDVVELAIQKDRQSAPFSYQFPMRGKDGRGIWTWNAIGPEYDAASDVPRELQMDRAPALRYPASRLVTELMENYRAVAHFRTVPFAGKDDDVRETFRWIKRQKGWGDVTPSKLASLRWQSLHQVTHGELASSSLILGLKAHAASVEMHYAVLEVSEARQKFNASSSILWGENSESCTISSEAAIVGARGFPKVHEVQQTIARLQKASRVFFGIDLRSFDPQQHARLLNDAVLYAVWHQFFCFATRAIRNAYQERSLFARRSQIAILSDKDFEDRHKTRLIWADRRLLQHMKSIEERLTAVRERLKNHRFPKDSPLFFLDDGKRALRITPKTVEDQLGAAFPFEVNAPRKLMRFLVRKAGLSHEDAEVFMGHWWDLREPWSPFSSFDWPRYLKRLETVIPDLLDRLGFTWIPEGAR